MVKLDTQIKMDIAIQKAETKMLNVSLDNESLRWYEVREKALSDWASGVRHAKKEGKLEVAVKMKNAGKPLTEIEEYTDLSREEIDRL